MLNSGEGQAARFLRKVEECQASARRASKGTPLQTNRSQRFTKTSKDLELNIRNPAYFNIFLNDSAEDKEEADNKSALWIQFRGWQMQPVIAFSMGTLTSLPSVYMDNGRLR
ncbi:hypothetical protein PAL_GLEAN10013907 [Pteropus alecto]|uniref:Uncharacterized protein n=1 Tax=Pteropus alecto TaxID=9402 RepID=L5K7C0_PTEAL|nr:hypothetical protein PAL_GLEAN10013907 [Pteropus alecto]